jgi:hypothetical protein
VLNLITLNGWLAVVAFLALAAACIGADLAVQRRLEPLPHRAVPPRGAGLAGVLATWESLSLRRRLAIADFHRRRLPETARQAAEREAHSLDEHLAGRARRESTAGGAGPTGFAGGSGGGILLALGLVAVGLTGIAGLLVAGALVPAAVILAVLDVGANCDPWCLASGAGGLGGSADPDEEEEEEEEEDCAGERRGVLEAQSRVDTYQAQLEHYGRQLEAMRPEAERLAQEAAALGAAARNELMLHAAWDAVYRIVSTLTGGFSGAVGMLSGDAGAVGGTALGELPGGDLPLLDAATFAQRLNQYYQIIQGDMSTLETLADAEGLTDVQRFLDKMRELGSLGARGAQIANQMDEIKVDQDHWKEELERRRQALRECEESVG